MKSKTISKVDFCTALNTKLQETFFKKSGIKIQIFEFKSLPDSRLLRVSLGDNRVHQVAKTFKFISQVSLSVDGKNKKDLENKLQKYYLKSSQSLFLEYTPNEKTLKNILCDMGKLHKTIKILPRFDIADGWSFIVELVKFP